MKRIDKMGLKDSEPWDFTAGSAEDAGREKIHSPPPSKKLKGPQTPSYEGHQDLSTQQHAWQWRHF